MSVNFAYLLNRQFIGTHSETNSLFYEYTDDTSETLSIDEIDRSEITRGGGVPIEGRAMIVP